MTQTKTEPSYNCKKNTPNPDKKKETVNKKSQVKRKPTPIQTQTHKKHSQQDIRTYFKNPTSTQVIPTAISTTQKENGQSQHSYHQLELSPSNTNISTHSLNTDSNTHSLNNFNLSVSSSPLNFKFPQLLSEPKYTHIQSVPHYNSIQETTFCGHQSPGKSSLPIIIIILFKIKILNRVSFYR